MRNTARNSAQIRRALSILTAIVMTMSIWAFHAEPARADALIESVPAGNYLRDLAVNETTNKIYVTNFDTNCVKVIDGATGDMLQTVAVGTHPYGLAVNKDDNKIYVVNSAANSLTVIDGSDDTVEQTVPLTGTLSVPIAVAWNPVADEIYVTHLTPGVVEILDGATYAVKQTVTVADGLADVAVNTAKGKIYAVSESGVVTVIDRSTYAKQTISVGSTPENAAVNESTNMIYVANSGAGTISFINGLMGAVAGTVTVGTGIWGVAVNGTTNRLYAGVQSNSLLAVIDAPSGNILQTISIPGGIGSQVAVDETRNRIYVLDINHNGLVIVDGNAIEAAGVTGLAAPETGAVPQLPAALVPGDARYAVTGLTWENLDGSPAMLSGGQFANAGCMYQARIELTAQGSYGFPAAGLTPAVNAGIPTAGTVAGGYAAGNTLTFVVAFPVDIASVTVAGLAAPATGETPQAHTGLTPGDAAKYTVTSLAWEETSGNPITEVTFPYGGAYFQARIVLTSRPGYKFPSGGLTPALDGDGTASPGTVSGGDVSGNTLTFVAQFSNDVFGYMAGVSGLAAPVAGGTPGAAADLTAYDSNAYCFASGLTWLNSNGSPATLSGGKFVSGGSSYKAVVELTAQPGYKFPSGDIGLYVDGDGTEAPGAASGGYVSGNKYTFEVTFSSDIASVGVTGLAAPVKGAVPVSSADLTAGDTARYNVSFIGWVNSDDSPAALTDGKFNGGTVYKANIYLSSYTGYKFPPSGVTAAVDAGTLSKITANQWYETGNMLTLEVTFPATASDIKPVTGITGMPTSATAGVPLALTGTVAPADATNRTIVWSVKNAGGTGAAISGSTFTATAAGAATVTATIVHGKNETTDYTQDFNIVVSAPPPPSDYKAVTDITGVPAAATVGAPLTLTGTVAPADATNSTILWSVKNAGGTGASVSGGTFTATAAGAATVKATIVHGKNESTDYTQDFNIAVSAPPNPQTPSSYLSGIKLSTGKLSKTFSPKTTRYTVNLGENDASVTVTPVRAYNSAALTIDGKKATSKTITLKNGRTVNMTIKVTWNRKTTTYTLTIRRAKSTNNRLSKLTASAGAWSVPFNPMVTSCKLTLPENVSKVTLKAAKASTLASLQPTSRTYTLRNGQTVKAYFTVKSQSGACRTYTVTITRAKSTNANLSSLTSNVRTAPVTPRFSAAMTSYTINLPSGRSTVTIYWKVAQKDARAYVNGVRRYNLRLSLRHGETRTVPIVVRAQDGSTRNYTVTVSRE